MIRRSTETSFETVNHNKKCSPSTCGLVKNFFAHIIKELHLQTGDVSAVTPIIYVTSAKMSSASEKT